MTDIEMFEEAFDEGHGGARGDCECGRVFYNSDGNWDFEQDELEELRGDPGATDVEWAVQYVHFEGTSYCVDCDCWRPRAELLIKFIIAHGDGIAKFLTARKDEAIRRAVEMPEVG